MAEHGLRVFSARGDFAQAVRTMTAVAAGDHHDLIILSCKAYDLDAAIAAVKPAVGRSTLVLPLLNGLRHLDDLDAAFGAAQVLGGLCHISVTLEADGSIRQFGALEKLTYGSRDHAQAIPASIGTALRRIGPNVVESDDVMAAMWDKFAFIATLAGITCLMRGSVGEIVATKEGAALTQRLHGECARIAERSGHALSVTALQSAQAILVAANSPLKASMLRDLERGARTECEHILGDLRERAIALEMDTPILAAALTHVRVYEAARARAVQ
jgi:2-dehydropantoate 2-reductase